MKQPVQIRKVHSQDTAKAPPQVRARELVIEFERLAALLPAEHKRHILERLNTAFAITGERCSFPAPARTTSAPVSGKANEQVACPQCTAWLRADRLDRHIRKVHPTPEVKKLVPAATPRSAPKTVKVPAHLKTVVCGDCNRSMTREDYQVHICRRRGPLLLQGGGPGLGRRR